MLIVDEEFVCFCKKCLDQTDLGCSKISPGFYTSGNLENRCPRLTKPGKWIVKINQDNIPVFTCGQCRSKNSYMSNFCPQCGHPMEV